MRVIAMFLQIFSLQSLSLSPSFRLTQHSLNTASCFSIALSWEYMLFHFSWRTEHQRVHMHSQWVSSPVPTAPFHCYHSPPSPFDHSRSFLFQYIPLGGFLSWQGLVLENWNLIEQYLFIHCFTLLCRVLFTVSMTSFWIPRIHWICKEDIICVAKPLQTEMLRKAICWVFGGWRG